VIGAAFEGRLPAGVRVTTKHRLGTPPADEVESTIIGSLEESLARMRLDHIDLFFLHSNIIPDDYDAAAYTDRPATRWTTYAERFVPVCEQLVADGRIGAWGITGIGIPECILRAMDQTSRPAAVQCIANPLDSPGELKYFDGPSGARDIITAGKAAGIGVFGIRAVQGGALTDALDRDLPSDHGVVVDYRNTAKFRALARELSVSAAALAHRYALTIEGIDTVVLGCKNREELFQCIDAAEAGPLEQSVIDLIDAACA
jgi:aryl-alcohol dehydrogenase-like predicted oxidoreductase